MKTLLTFLLFGLILSNSVYSDSQTNNLLKIADTASGTNKADVFVAIADYYFQNFYGLKTNELDSTMKYFTEALTISWNSKDIRRVLKILSKISIVYYSTGDFSKTLKINKFILLLSKKFHFVEDEINSLNRIALSYRFLDKPDSAETYFAKSILLGKRHKYFYSASMSLIGRGELTFYLGREDSAFIFFNEAVNYLKKDIEAKGFSFEALFSKKTDECKYDKLWNVAMSYITITHFYSETNQMKQALLFSDTALVMANIIQSPYVNTLVFEQKVVIWKEFQNPDSTIKYLELTSANKDSLFDNANSFQKSLLNAIELSREKKLKLIEQEGQIKDLNLQKIRIIVMGMVVMSIVIVIVSILLIRQQRMKRIEEKMKLERQALQLQMNPHFISNALVAIQSYIFTGDKLQAGKLLADFSEMMRLILKNSREEFVVLEQELKLLRHYLELQQLRYSDMFTWRFDVKGNLVPEQILIPPMIMQPFIENAIEHGVVPKGKGHITISIEIEENVILFQVEDNGVGRNKTHVGHYSNESRPHSTDITIDRLHVLMQKQSVFQFVVHDLLDSLNDPIGTRVSMNIPFKKIQNDRYSNY